MIEMSNFEDSQSLNSTNTPEDIEQSEMYHDSTERSIGLEDSLKNIKTDDDFKISSKKNNHRKFPLTEWSKREMAVRIRIEREKKLEQTKKFNQMITRGAEVIRNHSKKNHVNKAESLTRINTNLLHQDESLINCTDPLSPSLTNKIKVLESNLKKLETELIIEKNKFIGEEKRLTTVNNENFSVSDENTIDISDEIIKKNHSNITTEYLDESKYKELCTLNKFDNKIIPNLETRLSFNPKRVEFGVLRMNLNLVKGVLKRQIKVSNLSKNKISCRYSHIFDPNSILKDEMNIIKIKSASWCRLYPGVTVDYALTFKPVELPNSLIYLSLQGVKLVFETVTNNQPDVKYIFCIPVKFCIVKPEPELITKTITFPVERDSRENINPKNHLILKNNGDAECVFSVIKESDYKKTQHFDESDYSPSCSTETVINDCNLFECVNDSDVQKTVSELIVWSDHVNVLLPARGSVRVPVTFHQNSADSPVTESYVIAFNNDEYSIPNQRVTIVGHIRDQNVLLVKPNVIDVGLCYLTSSAQAAGFKLQNNSRVVLPFEIKLPRQLSKHVEFSPSKGYLRAESSMEISVRLSLKYVILKPDCRPYFDADTGFLDVPVGVCSGNSRKCHEVLHILAVVDTPFGLRLTPDTLDFGTVNTTETVVRDVWLANHSRTAVRYGFLKLPERVSVYPSAFGTIFSGEQVLLHVHYSPSAKDLPQNLYTFEDDFILTCNTMTGLNAEIYNSEGITVEQSNETISEEILTTSIMNQKIIESVNQIRNELDHGQDKIQISRLKNVVEVSLLDENAILKEASIRCHARIHEIPVELSVQKIIFRKTHFTSYSTYKIELRASNLTSIIERNISSFVDFKIRFEFVSNDPSVEFKPKNGILRSKEVIQIYVIYRPKLDNELQNKYEEYLNSEATKVETEQVLKDENSLINKVCKNKPFLHEQIKIFQAQILFYSSLMCQTKIISAACFVQFVNQRSKEHFGFDTESLKLSLVCPTTKPNIILFSNQIDFGKCAIDVRHNEWLLVKNVTTRPVPLKISLPNPIGPFFCAFALNGAQNQLFIPPGHTMPINVSFIPEREITISEILEVTSGTMRLPILLCGCGVGPSCKISPDDMFNIIQTTHEQLNNTIIFRVTNTSGTNVRFNVQMEWVKERLEPMVDDEAYGFVEALRTASASVRDDVVAATKLQEFVFEDWTGLNGGADVGVFDMGNGGRPLRFRLDRNSSRYVYVTFRPRAATAPVQARPDVQDGSARGPREDDDEDGFSPVFQRHAYAAKFNVYVGHSVLQRFFVLGFVDEKPT